MRKTTVIAVVLGALPCGQALAATISAGARHTLVRSSDGRVWAWGDGARGQLGTGAQDLSTVPVVLDGLGEVVAVAAGAEHSMALTSDGTVFAWGANEEGQIGDGSLVDRGRPVRVRGLRRVVAIAAGRAHSLALDSEGRVWAWGGNAEGQIGDGTHSRRLRPIPAALGPVRAVAAGASHSLAVTSGGAVWSWGAGAARPQAVSGLPAITAVSGGSGFSIALSEDGRAFAWAALDATRVPGLPAGAATPAVVPGLASVIAISAGSRHALAVTTGGWLYAWGEGERGQLGLGEPVASGPRLLSGLSTIEIAAASSGAHSLAVTTDGIVWAWGANTQGQVGDGTQEERRTPVQITEPGYACLVGTPVLHPAGGTFASAVNVSVRCATPGAEVRYTTDGTDPKVTDALFDQRAGVLIETTTTLRARAFRKGMPASNVAVGAYSVLPSSAHAPAPAGMQPARPGQTRERTAAPEDPSTLVFTPGTLAAGLSHSLVLKPDGTVWSFGLNSSGQLGDGTTTNRAYPVQVSGLTGVTAIAAGAYHSLALKSDGSVWTWGYGASGQLGHGLTTNRTTPIQVLTGAAAIAGGSNHTLAVKANGTIWAWGSNTYGQLGDGTTTQSSLPVEVEGITTGTRVAAGHYHSAALKSDGTIWCWGANSLGQLGDGTTTQSTTPVRADGATSIANVIAGRSNLGYGGVTSLALRDDGAVLGWGNNSVGELGDGTTLQRVTAVLSLMSGAAAVAAGAFHGVAVKSDGALWAWGENSSGQLGDGTTSPRLVPVSIPAPTAVVAVAAGGTHTLAVTEDGSVWAWGYNGQAQLGDGTVQTRTSPRQIAGPGFTWYVATPVLSPVTGTFSTSQTVTVTNATPGATIRYTTNGDEPSPSSTVIASGGTVSVPQSLTLKAKAWKSGWTESHTAAETYTLKAVTPVAAPAGGSYTSTQNVTLSTTTSGATIRYTTDGSEPGPSSTAYSAPVFVATTLTLKSKAFKSGWSDSETRTDTYTLTLGTLAAPQLSPAAGTYLDSVEVTMSGPAGATIRYTTNGVDPTASSTAYTGAITVTQTTTVKARAFDPSYNASAVTTAVYTIKVSAPALSPSTGTYAIGQLVTASGPSGSTLRYSVNGNDPTASDAEFPSGGVVPVAQSALKVKAFRTGCTASDTEAETYTITGVPAGGGVEGGFYHSLAHNASGSAWSWGSNSNGQLGDGTTTQRATPVPITALSQTTAVVAGDSHSLALKSDGTVRSFGANGNGQLGDGSYSQRTSPVTVSTLSGVTAIAAGGLHSLAVKSDGTLWTWGHNQFGQLGDGTNTQSNSPVQVSSLSGIVAVAGGFYHSLALKNDGTVFAFGYNQYGQLGNSTTSNSSTPVQVSGLTGVTAVAAGAHHSLALKSDGTLWAWGYNVYGQLGDGTPTQRTTPVQVANISGVRSVAAGYYHTLAARADGSAMGWGFNTPGQVGDGTTTNRTSPVPVVGLSGVDRVAAHNHHSLALDRQGAIWAWGHNQNNQLGDGTTVHQTAPVRVSDPSFDWKVGTPTLTPGGGAYTSSQNVVVSCVTAGATIHYTTNGIDPTTGDATVASGESVSVGQSLTLKAKAFKTGMAASNVAAGTYTLTLGTPTAIPTSGTYSTNQSVSLSTSATGATIRYTTDGSPVSESSTAYTGPITVDQTLSIKAKAWKTGWNTSNETLPLTYTMKVGTPVLNPGGGPYSAVQNVTVTTVTPGALLHYSTSEPTESDPVVVSGGSVLVDRSMTLRVRGWKLNWTASDTTGAAYTLGLGTVATPAFSPAAGTYATAQTVSMSSATSGAVIRYTTDGSDPTFTSRLYYAPIVVDWTTTLKAQAFKAEWTPSAAATATYTIEPSGTAAPASVAPAPGTYPTSQTVALTTATAGAAIHYTTNGAEPSTSDPSVSSGGTVVIDRSTTLRAKAFKTGLTASPTRRGDYFITGAIAAAYQHAAALKVDGTLWTWGVNGDGQVGNGLTTPQPTPVEVLTNVRAVSVTGDSGRGHTLAVKGDGTLWGWGDNQFGMLCDGSSNNDRTSPVQASGITTAVAVAAGGWHTLVLKTDGTVASCGYNQYGQLGDGTTTQRTTPVAVSGLTDVVAIAAGYHHSLALKRDGTVWAWGNNGYGQLGDGTASQRTTPVQVSALRGVVALAAGTYHSVALRTEGTQTGEVWTWGYNGNGQLGDATTTNRDVPVKVLVDVLGVHAEGSQIQYRRGALAAVAVWASGLHNGYWFTTSSAGNGTVPINTSVPAFLGSGAYVSLAPGTGFSIALRQDTTLYVWGASAGAYSAANGMTLGYASGTDDPDQDGLTTAQEWMLGTDPWNADTNGDGIRDGAAIASGRSATHADMDGDGVLNAVEAAGGTDPFNPDTDGDAVGDGTDCFPLDPARSTCPEPTPGDVTPPVITLTEPTNATLSSSVPPQ